MKGLLGAFALLAASATQANAATFFAHAGTQGVDYTEAVFTPSSTLGAEFTENSSVFRSIDLSGQMDSVLGQSVSNIGGFGFAITDASGEQFVLLTDRFYSSFMPTADYYASAELEFEGANGTLFQGSQLLVDNLARYFVGGTVNYAAGAPAIVLALPEAGTWMMMVIGLGIIGGALRRQKIVRSPVSAG